MSLNLYEFLVFNNKEKLLFYEDLKKPSNNSQAELIRSLDKTQVHRIENISGIAEATKSLVEKLSPSPRMTFKFFTTNRYKYNIYELPTGLKFILITGMDNFEYLDALMSIYTEVYVEFVTKNVLAKRDDVIESIEFKDKVREILKSL